MNKILSTVLSLAFVCVAQAQVSIYKGKLVTDLNGNSLNVTNVNTNSANYFVGNGAGLTNVSGTGGTGISTNGGSGTGNIFTNATLNNASTPTAFTFTNGSSIASQIEGYTGPLSGFGFFTTNSSGGWIDLVDFVGGGSPKGIVLNTGTYQGNGAGLTNVAAATSGFSTNANRPGDTINISANYLISTVDESAMLTNKVIYLVSGTPTITVTNPPAANVTFWIEEVGASPITVNAAPGVTFWKANGQIGSYATSLSITNYFAKTVQFTSINSTNWLIQDPIPIQELVDRSTTAAQGVVNNTLTLPKQIYVMFGMDNISNNVAGCNEAAWSIDGKKYLQLNGGKSMFSGTVPGAPYFTTNTFTPVGYQNTNGLWYVYSSPNSSAALATTNVYVWVSSNLVSWSYLGVIPIYRPSISQAYVNKVGYDASGNVQLALCISTNSGVNQDAYYMTATDNTGTNFTAPAYFYSTNGVLLAKGAGIDGDATSFCVTYTGSNYVGLLSDNGSAGVVYTSASYGTNWLPLGTIASTTGNALKGEEFDIQQLPDGTWGTHYDDSPGNATLGYIRLIDTSSNFPTYGALSLSGLAYDPNEPYIQGRTTPFRFGNVFVCTNITLAMIPGLLYASDQEGVLWGQPANIVRPAGSGGPSNTLTMQTYFQAPFYNGLNDGLLVWYPFSEGQGTVITNYTPYGPNASLTASTIWTNSAHYGSGLNLDGVNYGLISSQQSTFGQSNFTWSLWFNQNKGTDSTTRVFLSNAGNGSLSTPGQFNIELGTSGSYGFLSYLYQTNFNGIIYVPGTWPATNTWHNLVVTYDGVSNRIWLDASLVATGQQFGTNAQPVSGNVGIGAFNAGVDPFNGEIDDVRYWNRALSTNEILGLFNGRN
jgi:hypothetical protein